MTDEQATPNPDGGKESGEPTDYVSRRAAELRAAKEPKEEKPAEPEKPEVKPKIPEEEEEEAEADTTEAEEEEEEVDEETEETGEIDEIVLSQVNYDELTEESAEELGRVLAAKLGDNIGAFSKGAGSGLGKDVGKLRGKLRDVEEENRKLKEGLEKVSPQSNSFSHVADVSQLDTEEKTLVELYDYYEDIALKGAWEESQDGEEGVTNNGKFYPKDEMLNYIKGWKQQLREIPTRRSQLQKRGAVSKEREKVAKTLGKTLEWFGDSESEQSQAYSELMNDSSVASAIQLFPDLEPKLMEAIAYSIEGKSGKQRKKIEIPLRNKPKPSGGGDNGAAGSGRKKSRGLQEAEERISTGKFTESDWVKARSQKYSKFFNKP